MIKTALTSALLFAIPVIAFAQGTFQLAPIRNLIQSVAVIVASLVPILITLALVAFFWGLVRYIWGGVKDNKYGAKLMAWSLLALFVMVSVWGITRLIGQAIGVTNNQAPEATKGFVPSI